MTTPDVKKINTVYPLFVSKYETFTLDEEANTLEKMNSIIQNLNRVGQVSNETVKQWNKVMAWVLDEGLTENVVSKINELAESGTFDEIIASNLDEFKEETTNTVETFTAQVAGKASQAALDLEKARINNLVANAGNTTGNAELNDIRVNEFGTTFATAGEATRAVTGTQLKKLQDYGTGLRDNNTPSGYASWLNNSIGYFKSYFDTSLVSHLASLLKTVNLSAAEPTGLGFIPNNVSEFTVYIRVTSTAPTQKVNWALNTGGSWGGFQGNQKMNYVDVVTNRWVKYEITQDQLDAVKANTAYTTNIHLVLQLTQLTGTGYLELMILDTRKDTKTNKYYATSAFLSDRANVSALSEKALSSDFASIAQQSDTLKGFAGWEKVILSSEGATKAGTSTNTATITPYLSGTDKVGYKLVGDIKDTLYAYGYARLTPDKVYNDFKTKKVKVVLKSDKAVKFSFRLSNAGAWGSADNTIQAYYSEVVDLNAGNNFTKEITIDYSLYQNYYADPIRQADNLQRLYILTIFNEGVTSPPMGVHTVYAYAYYDEIKSTFDSELSSKYVNSIPSKTEFETEIERLEEKIEYGTVDEIVAIGDSLTAGGGSSGWVSLLSTLTGLPTFNAGTGGENTQTITARQGADVMIVNNITIPADTSEIQLGTYASGIPTQFGKKATPLLQGGTAHVNPSYIDGVEGTLRWTGASYNDAAGVWMWKRNVAGTAKTINRPTALITNLDKNHNKGIQIIFIGQNGGYVDNDDLVNLHKLMIRHNDAKETVILGLSSGTAAERLDYETKMKKEFGRYFVSLREYLSQYGLADAGLTPTTADNDAIALGKAPPQLFTDGIHFTNATQTVIANMLYKKMKELNIF